MTRRIVVLVAACVLGVTAGAALGKPPPGPQPEPGPQPVDPPPASLCPQFPHPTITCSAVAVTCPSSPKAQFVCTTSASAGPVDATTRKLELQLPRRYPKLALTCQVKTGVDITCRVTSRTITRASGMRVVVLRLPSGAGAVRIACATTTRFACKIR